jgi:hypothetical protein
MSASRPSLDFRSIFGRNHLIEPVGYGRVRKIVRLGSAVRSAREQFEIHETASQFPSTILRVPTPYSLIAPFSYTMEHVYEGIHIAPHEYASFSDLQAELTRFYEYMIACGYFPYGYTILKPVFGAYTLLDFSEFGTVQRDRVRFKHYRGYTFSLDQAWRELGPDSFTFLPAVSGDAVVYDPVSDEAVSYHPPPSAAERDGEFVEDLDALWLSHTAQVNLLVERYQTDY